MSVNLWQFFLEDDVDTFRQYLANATYSATAQRTTTGGAAGNVAFKIGSPGASATSPRTPVKSRKSSGYTQSTAGTSQAKGLNTVLTRADVNAKDGFGRTLLHHVASSRKATAVEFAAALLEVPLLDLYAQDTESGWTALHRALYFGNVSIAQALMLRDIKDATDYTTAGSHIHAGGLIKIKDHEGNSPFEVFGLTIASRLLEAGGGHPSLDPDDGSNVSVDLNGDEDDKDFVQKRLVNPITNLEGDEAFAFGSNKNLTLGLGDEDDRQYPERLSFQRPEHLLRRLRDDHELKRTKSLPSDDLTTSRLESSHLSQIPAVVRAQPLQIQDVVMSKLHTAVLTNDPISNLFVCGFGSGGRLGTGDEVTRFSYVCLQAGGLSNRRVASIALGQDHSIAVTSTGEVFSWGSNRYGQLGYALPELSAGEIPTQLVPKQLYGHIKREAVIGAAASSIHSAIFTSTALYTFGKNEGQLGLMDADAGSLVMQTIPRRIGVSVLQSPIKSISAIDRATCVLLESHEVIIFTHYGFKKVENFPLYAFRNYALARAEGNTICKITTGGNTVCALSTFGEVFTIDVPKCESPSISGSTTNPNKARNALGIPSRVWSIKKSHMSAIDVAVGQDGSIILCAESGSVWRKEKRAKFKSVAVKDSTSTRPKDYKFVRVPNLTRAIAVRSNAFGAFVAIRRDCHVTREQIIVDPPALWDNMFSLLAFRQYRLEETADSSELRPRFWTPAIKDFSPGQIKHAILRSHDAEEDLMNIMKKLEPLADSQYDLWITSNVTDVRIPVHSFLIKSRSSVLRRALTEFQEFYYYSIPDLLSIEYGVDGEVHMKFVGADFLTVLNFAFYLYTDNIIDVWHHIGKAVHMAPRYRQVRAELMKIATHLELRHLERAVRVMTDPIKALRMDMENAIRDPEFFSDHDLLIELADDVELPAHSALLCVRCPFFDGLFRGRAGGRWMAHRKGEAVESADAIRVDLTHIDVRTFEIVLRHMYADTGDELFDDIVTDNFDSFVDLVIEVMSVANELMLERLAQICQAVLGKFATTRNICSLLNTASECSVEEFKHVALEYIGLNLESMLEHRLLEELDPDLLYELDEMIQSNQLAFMPFARSSRAQNDLLEQYPDLLGQIEDAQKRRVDSMRLRTRFSSEDEDRPTSSNKLRVGSFAAGSPSPSTQQGRRTTGYHPQSPADSPDIQPREGEHDLQFDMDDENPVAGLGIGLSSLSNRPRDKSYTVSPLLGPSEWMDARGKPVSESIGTDTSSLAYSMQQPAQPSPAQSRSRASAPAVRIEGFNLPAPAWKSAAPSSFKTDLRDVMSQASTTQTSNLTRSMKGKGQDTVKAAKMSQKERKKLQQQQQENLRLLEHTPDPPRTFAGVVQPVVPAASPWQKVEKASKASLKDALAEPTSSPPSSVSKPVPKTTMTMRQTVSGTSPLPSRQQPRSVSTPNVITPSSKPAPQIQSVRHLPAPTSSSMIDSSRSMAEILAQQDLEKRAVKEAVAKRSLQEIQQEQEFQQWWDSEARRVQEEEEAANVAAAARGRGKAGRGRGGKGRGRGAAGAGESMRGRGRKRTTTS
jgi:alpha-tubulin suppressor-like RCC1 family protein